VPHNTAQVQAVRNMLGAAEQVRPHRR
jgi:hypothetical protein